jgi:hypothetical protein
MEKALGVAFDSKDGEHLFRSTLVQTLFYGVFSPWVALSRTGGAHFGLRFVERAAGGGKDADGNVVKVARRPDYHSSARGVP